MPKSDIELVLDALENVAARLDKLTETVEQFLKQSPNREITRPILPFVSGQSPRRGLR